MLQRRPPPLDGPLLRSLQHDTMGGETEHLRQEEIVENPPDRRRDVVYTETIYAFNTRWVPLSQVNATVAYTSAHNNA